MTEIRIVGPEDRGDICLKNEPFPLWGRMCPRYADGRWDYTVERFAPEKVGQMCFPDEDYDYDAMAREHVFLAAYEDGQCVALAVLRQAMFRYMYLYDLKVNAACRGRGVGRRLVDRALALAAEQGYRGLYTVGQDNNLSACLFYVGTGFRIGGLDTEVYTGTSQQGKADILFYRDA